MPALLKQDGGPVLTQADKTLDLDTRRPGPSFIKIVATATTANGLSTAVMSATFSGSVPAGNTLIVSLNGGSNGEVASVSDTAGNVYEIDRNSTATTGGQIVRTLVANPLQAGDVITVTRTNSIVQQSIIVAEFAGVGTLDQVATTNATSSDFTGSAPTTTSAPQLVVGILGVASVTANIISSDPAWTRVAFIASFASREMAMFYRVLDTVDTPTLSGTIDISTAAWRVTVATYKAAL